MRTLPGQALGSREYEVRHRDPSPAELLAEVSRARCSKRQGEAAMMMIGAESKMADDTIPGLRKSGEASAGSPARGDLADCIQCWRTPQAPVSAALAGDSG